MINPRNHKDPLPPATNVMVDIKAETDREESEARDIERDKVPTEARDTYARVVKRLVGWRGAGAGSNAYEKGEES